jgi:hypothetical protein
LPVLDAGSGRTVRYALLSSAQLRMLDAAQWQSLTLHAADPNPYYGRCYVLAGLDHLGEQRQLQALAFYAGDCLVGLFFFREKYMPYRAADAAIHLYQPSSLPLIHRDHVDAVVTAWGAAMDEGLVPKHWRFAHLDLQSAFARAAETRIGLRFDALPTATYKRVRLTRTNGGFEAHLQSLAKSRVKDLQRNIRRLRELGELRFERAKDPKTVGERIESFLTLENSGWKGEEGTSFLAQAGHAAFARKAFIGGDHTSVDSLLLDGIPIAMSINIRVGDTKFTPKCTYDERLRRFSPGLVLEYFVLEAFYASGELAAMDASTTVDGHVVADLWNSQRLTGTVLIGPQNSLSRVIFFCHDRAARARHWLKRQTGAIRRPIRHLIHLARSWMTSRVSQLWVGGFYVIEAGERLIYVI